MDNLFIRPAEKSDFESIYRFVCALENTIFDKDVIQQCYHACLDAKNNYYLVAETEGKAIGYVSCHGQILLHHAGLVYEIEEFYVEDAYRSHGVGKKLLQALEQILSHTDYELLEVASNMKRADAHRFYITNGFDKTTYKFTKFPK